MEIDSHPNHHVVRVQTESSIKNLYSPLDFSKIILLDPIRDFMYLHSRHTKFVLRTVWIQDFGNFNLKSPKRNPIG